MQQGLYRIGVISTSSIFQSKFSKTIDLNKNRTGEVLEFITLMGNARHKNLVRLLGYCNNKKVVWLLYDCAVSTWAAKYKVFFFFLGKSKYKVVMGIARGL